MPLKSKFSKFLAASLLLHIIAAFAMSAIYAEQAVRTKRLRFVSSVKIEYKEAKQPPKPKPKIIPKTEPTEEKAEPKEVKPKPVKQKLDPPKVTRSRRNINAPAPGLATEKATVRSRSMPGVEGLKGKSGAPGDRPGMRASGGINNPDLTTRTGGTGLSPEISHGSMKMPTGTGRLPGAGGKDMAGFRMGKSPTGTGAGRIDLPGRGGSGGNRGRADEGPGAGASSKGRLDRMGAGDGTTGLGTGSTEGMGEGDTESGGTGTGGGGGGPGIGGTGSRETRKGPSVSSDSSKNKSGSELPEKKEIPEEKRTGATGKKEFKADLTKIKPGETQEIEKPSSKGYENALQAEIN
ncbi:hypothetical protein GF312_14805, partial [Candidatus Poribacteria bacterium]|nr:hypothetical protein [Candidatus Poribacteria bacterium]